MDNRLMLYGDLADPESALAFIASELGRLAIAYPVFRFGYEAFGRHGARWIAERRDGLQPGLHTVITANLAELRDALAHACG